MINSKLLLDLLIVGVYFKFKIIYYSKKEKIINRV